MSRWTKVAEMKVAWRIRNHVEAEAWKFGRAGEDEDALMFGLMTMRRVERHASAVIGPHAYRAAKARFDAIPPDHEMHRVIQILNLQLS